MFIRAEVNIGDYWPGFTFEVDGNDPLVKAGLLGGQLVEIKEAGVAATAPLETNYFQPGVADAVVAAEAPKAAQVAPLVSTSSSALSASQSTPAAS